MRRWWTIECNLLFHALKEFRAIILAKESLSHAFRITQPLYLANAQYCFGIRLSGIWNVLRRVFVRAIEGPPLFPAPALIDKFDRDFLSHPLQMSIAPYFEWKSRRCAAAFLR